jgi:hypothetical protein
MTFEERQAEKQALIWQVANLEVWPAECEPPLARGINGELVVGNEKIQPVSLRT